MVCQHQHLTDVYLYHQVQHPRGSLFQGSHGNMLLNTVHGACCWSGLHSTLALPRRSNASFKTLAGVQGEMKPAIARSEKEFDERKGEWAFERAQLEQRLQVVQKEHERTSSQLRSADQALYDSDPSHLGVDCTPTASCHQHTTHTSELHHVLAWRRIASRGGLVLHGQHSTWFMNQQQQLLSTALPPPAVAQQGQLPDSDTFNRLSTAANQAKQTSQACTRCRQLACRGELRHEVQVLTTNLNDKTAELHGFKASHEGLPAALRTTRATADAAKADAVEQRAAATSAAAEVATLRAAAATQHKQLQAAETECAERQREAVQARDLVAKLTSRSAEQRSQIRDAKEAEAAVRGELEVATGDLKAAREALALLEQAEQRSVALAGDLEAALVRRSHLLLSVCLVPMTDGTARPYFLFVRRENRNTGPTIDEYWTCRRSPGLSVVRLFASHACDA
jgi:hypothetical protein